MAILPTGFEAFQAVLARTVSSLEPAHAEAVLEDIQGLEGWGGDLYRPQSLHDLEDVTPSSLLCWFNPSLGLSVCAALGLTSRDAYDMEMRSERLLPRLTRGPLTQRVDLKDEMMMAHEIGGFMMTHGAELVSGLFHVASQRLYVGLSILSHSDIAWSAARIKDRAEYTRLRFSLRDGVLKADWMPAYDDEAYSARRTIQRMIPTLFGGIPVRH